MGSQSVLSKTFTISLLLHAGLLAGLVLFVSRAPVVSDTPLRVRILEEPAPQAVPQAPTPAVPPRQAGREATEPPRRSAERGRPEVQTERLAPRPVPVPDKPAVPPPPPQVAARPAPEVNVPAPKAAAPPPDMPREAPREATRDPLPPAQPERGGLILRGPSQAAPSLPPASSERTTKRLSQPSLRDQIASLGSKAEVGEAKRTINLDDRQPDFLPYLERLKRRVYDVWSYPQEAGELGLGGEVQLVFTLNKGGTLTSLRLVQSSGFHVLDNEAMRAIRVAAPYDPFPPKMGDEPINIRGSFQYVFSSARLRRKLSPHAFTPRGLCRAPDLCAVAQGNGLAPSTPR